MTLMHLGREAAMRKSAYCDFPFHSLPHLLQETFMNVSEDIQAPEGLILSSLLSAMSLASQGLIDVCPLEGKVWPVSLFFLTLAESGERKSSVEQKVMLPFHEFELAIAEQDALKKKAYETELMVWKKKQSAMLNEIGRNEKRHESTNEQEMTLKLHNEREPQQPMSHKLLYSNITSQALLAEIAGRGRSVGLIADEGGNILERGVVQDLSSINLLWDGATLSVDRKTEENISVIGARLTFSVMSQRAVFDRFILRQGDVPRGSGFLARCLPVYIDKAASTQGQRFINNNRPLYTHGLESFHTRIREFLELQYQGEPRKTLKFSPKAQKRWIEYYNYFERQIAPGGDYAEISDFGSKMANNVARLAALFHFFFGDGNSDEIFESMVDMAFNVCQWYAQQALRLFSPENNKLRKAEALRFWLVEKFCNKGIGQIKKNDILKYAHRDFRDKESLNDTLELLQENGCVYVRQGYNKAIYVYAGSILHVPLIA